MKLRSLTNMGLIKRIFLSKYAALKNRDARILREEHARLKSCLIASPNSYFSLDSELRIVEANPAAAELLGVSVSTLQLSPLLSYISSSDRVDVLRALTETTGSEKGKTDTISPASNNVQTINVSMHVEDRYVPVRLHVSLINSSQDKSYQFHIAMVDLSEQHAARNDLRIARDGLHHVATHDPLTRLPNRFGFMEQLQSAIDASGNNEVVLMLLDLDHFKQINDPLGHHTGDKLLREVTGRLVSSVSKGDVIGRLGGDEFAIILQNISTASDISQVADKISIALAEPYRSTAHDIRLTTSIGISLSPTDTRSARQMLSYADAAMNNAKLRGRNCVQFYTSALNTTLTARFELERDLRIALRESQFELYYQPQYDLRSRSITSYEVLLRWNHPDRGVVGPDTFIHVVEETGLIEPLGEWIILEACKKLVALRRTNKDVKFSINVSAKQFVSGNLQEKITAILQTTGAPANAIELELTESALLEDIDHSLSVLHDLRAAGVELAIDDFGTGYSSFSRLQQLPVTRVKIDRCFVHNIPENQNNLSIVKAIISVAHALGIEVVAEGVETSNQVVALEAAGCDVLQGYYLGRPARFSQLKPKAEPPLTALPSFRKEVSVA